MNQDIEKILLSEEDIAGKVRELGETLAAEYKDKNPLVICVLKGAVIFMADLIRHMSIPCEMDFMAVSSYGSGTESSGMVKILKDLDTSVENRHVLVVEDIMDSGLTLSRLVELLRHREAASVKVVTLLNKPERRKVDISPDYKGYDVPDEFVVGYGLDYAEHYRNLPYIGVLKPEVYTK
ncbi:MULTISPECIES: hypoxanthine phosphoribosyltransferase [Bacillales]|uniref:Hypoxanthine phosphoribosyltransferase n=1 Tax=Brevibacillus brevis (strain 47 / JCM 6285 / NBRC 100599) TaxID=358681 RepID=C0ZHF8_BREBN|nr:MULTISPECIES: hypoxanthine phosphoribosyltransferase [Bacillales]KMZ43383.1 hypoxanthine phosphoribosyltransferase [Bacillus sp. FJAT-27238]NQF17419.1 hypoxanthine phosphoribosyltransferase [Brevibacillus sp. HB1.3]NRR05425.1 hypoxanthine phosphoribosyltransferase [Brevibacillus sp. RS1.1]TQR30029.1 hypoxanthine phosphoribosyltransferase [Lysinibacillus sp. SDF0063]UIO42700.1 hypoxanthine phosphoribosyltransferase [Brevibacillus brevis]